MWASTAYTEYMTNTYLHSTVSRAPHVPRLSSYQLFRPDTVMVPVSDRETEEESRLPQKVSEGWCSRASPAAGFMGPVSYKAKLSGVQLVSPCTQCHRDHTPKLD